MIQVEVDPQCCHQEEDLHLPSLSHPQVAQGDFPCLLPATEVVPQSHKGTECLPQGLMWAQSLIVSHLQYLIRQDPFNQIYTTEGPHPFLGLPDHPTLDLPLPLSLEIEVLLLEEAP